MFWKYIKEGIVNVKGYFDGSVRNYVDSKGFLKCCVQHLLLFF